MTPPRDTPRMGDLLWRPSPERVASSLLTRFAGVVGDAVDGDPFDYGALHRWSVQHPDLFWASVWRDAQVVGHMGEGPYLDGAGRMPGARWFPAARLNVVDTLLAGPGHDEVLIARDEAGHRRSWTRATLRREVAACAASLVRDGVGAGDRVAAVLPHGAEAIVAMLATASIGGIWSSASPDFGVEGIVDRFGTIEPTVLIVQDRVTYAGATHDLRARIRAVATRLPTVRTIVVVSGPSALAPSGGGAADLVAGGSCGSADATDWTSYVASDGTDVSAQRPRFPFDHPLYVLFSSGTTGRPKAIVHGAGGTLLQHLKEHRLHTDVHPGDTIFYFTTTGWMMWNWLASALASRARVVVYDGSPVHPDPLVLWRLAEEERVAVFGTSAGFLHALAKQGVRPGRHHTVPSLKTILSTGSPLSPHGFGYVYDAIASDVSLSSISGGTDIVSCFALGSPWSDVRAGELQVPGLGMAVDVFGDDGAPRAIGAGELVCTRPFPSMPLRFWGDDSGRTYRRAYFERFAGVWAHGDLAEWTPSGGLVIHGRSDAVLNPGGVRIGTAEIYRQLEAIPEIVEAVCIGQPVDGDERTVLFVQLRDGVDLDDVLMRRIRTEIRHRASPRHVPAIVAQVPSIPKTRSGKVSELAVRRTVLGLEVEGREALANPESLDAFRDHPALVVPSDD